MLNNNCVQLEIQVDKQLWIELYNKTGLSVTEKSWNMVVAVDDTDAKMSEDNRLQILKNTQVPANFWVVMGSK